MPIVQSSLQACPDFVRRLVGTFATCRTDDVPPQDREQAMLAEQALALATADSPSADAVEQYHTHTHTWMVPVHDLLTRLAAGIPERRSVPTAPCWRRSGRRRRATRAAGSCSPCSTRSARRRRWPTWTGRFGNATATWLDVPAMLNGSTRGCCAFEPGPASTRSCASPGRIVAPPGTLTATLGVGDDQQADVASPVRQPVGGRSRPGRRSCGHGTSLAGGDERTRHADPKH